MADEQTNQTEANSTVITGGQPVLPKHRRRILIIVLGILVLAVIAGYVTYRIYDMYRDRQVAATEFVDLQKKAAALGNSYDYSGFSHDQADIKLRAAGISWDTAKQGDLSKLNFDQAYVVARVLRVEKNYDRSLVAYKVAAAEVPKEADYTFYRGYSEVALFANKTDLWKQVMQKQKQAILADNSLNDDTKQTASTKIDEAIRLKELGW